MTSLPPEFRLTSDPSRPAQQSGRAGSSGGGRRERVCRACPGSAQEQAHLAQRATLRSFCHGKRTGGEAAGERRAWDVLSQRKTSTPSSEPDARFLPIFIGHVMSSSTRPITEALKKNSVCMAEGPAGSLRESGSQNRGEERALLPDICHVSGGRSGTLRAVTDRAEGGTHGG